MFQKSKEAKERKKTTKTNKEPPYTQPPPFPHTAK